MKGKIPYQREDKYRNYERDYSKNPDYSSYPRNSKQYEPGSGNFEMRGRNKQKSTSRGARSMQGGLSRSPSRSPGRSDSRSRSRSGNRSRSQSADRKLGCVRCGSKLHLGKLCTIFPYCETKCRICDFYHRTQFCNKKKGQSMEANIVDVVSLRPVMWPPTS